MPVLTISIETLAEVIKNLTEEELSTLELMLSKEGFLLKTRWKEIQNGEVKPLSREEVFSDDLQRSIPSTN